MRSGKDAKLSVDHCRRDRQHTEGNKGQKRREGLMPERETCSNDFLALKSVFFKGCKD